MKFKNRSEFVSWFEEQIRNKAIFGWISPSSCETAAKLICKQLSSSIKVPSPYENWCGISDYAQKVWDKNYRLLCFSECETEVKASSSYSSQNTRQTSYIHSNYSHGKTVSQTESCFTKDKSGVEKGYNLLLSSLNDAISSFKMMKIMNPDLVKSKTNILSKLSESLTKITTEKDYAFKCMSWDKLVIGFFGETNAGKSTIIESLRILLNEPVRSSKLNHNIKTDGEIVGDGRQDFTQDYHEYTLKIDNQWFSLIDVPGIEGKENLYKGKIGEALRKAHIIFYVNGHNKDVDRGTANKIKQYMGDGVKVFVIQNVRGNAESYEYPEDRRLLISEGVRTVMSGLDSKFRSLLSDKFGKIIAVQGLLAMCAYAEFSSNRADLTKKQNRLLSYFGEDCRNNNSQTRENIKRFSNIDSVINLIKERAKNYKGEIADANFTKLGKFCTQSLNEFISIVEYDKSRFLSYKNRIEQFKKNNLEFAQIYATQFEKECQQSAMANVNAFSKVANNLIEGCEFGQIKIEFHATKRQIEEKIKSLGQTYTSRLRSSINSTARELRNIPCFSTVENSISTSFEINVNFNVNLIISEDEISFGDVCKSVGSTIGGAGTGAAIGSLFGPIGTIIGGIIGGGGGLLSGNVSAAEDQTRRAKKKAMELISSVRYQYESGIKKKAAEFRQSALSHVSKVNFYADNGINEINEINQFYSCAAHVESNLRQTLTSVNNYGK